MMPPHLFKPLLQKKKSREWILEENISADNFSEVGAGGKPVGRVEGSQPTNSSNLVCTRSPFLVSVQGGCYWFISQTFIYWRWKSLAITLLRGAIDTVDKLLSTSIKYASLEVQLTITAESYQYFDESNHSCGYNLSWHYYDSALQVGRKIDRFEDYSRLHLVLWHTRVSLDVFSEPVGFIVLIVTVGV